MTIIKVHKTYEEPLYRRRKT